MTQRAAIGVYGLGVMGRNIALQLAEKGVPVAAFDPWPDARAHADGLSVAASERDFVAALEPPGAVLLMVKAGAPVDDAIAALAPLLPKGALIADGGNSHFRDSERRGAALAQRGIDFLGIGISGGETGARHGASIMAGGERAAFERLAPMLERLTARAGDALCLAHFGPGGAGHFAKMVHNGLEYAEMQLIAEGVLLLREFHGLDWPAVAAGVADWNQGRGASYLLEITSDLLPARDRLSGAPLIEIVADRAEQKGTGQWGAVAALELGIPVPTLVAAVEARALGGARGARGGTQVGTGYTPERGRNRRRAAGRQDRGLRPGPGAAQGGVDGVSLGHGPGAARGDLAGRLHHSGRAPGADRGGAQGGARAAAPAGRAMVSYSSG